MEFGDDFARIVEESYSDPVWFVREVLGAEPEPYQAEILQALARGENVTVRSSHGVGKTCVGAWAVLWFLFTRHQSKVITTAPTWHQVEMIIWSEVHKWAKKSILSHFMTLLGCKAEISKDWFAVGSNSNKPENMEGYHAEHLLYWVDEAKTVEQEIFDAIWGTQTTKAQMLLTSTAGPPIGYFYDTHCSPKTSKSWTQFHVPAHISKRVTREWIEARKEEWGEHTTVFQMRVLGNFPDSAEDSLFKRSWIESSMSLDDVRRPSPYMYLGVDVAEYGSDLTVFTLVEVNDGIVYVRDIKWSEQESTTSTVGRIKALIKEHNVRKVYVDAIGVGRGVVDMLREDSIGAEVVDVKASHKAERPEDEQNFKTTMYMRLQRLMEPDRNGKQHIKLLKNQHLIEELMLMRYKHMSSGKVQIVDPPKSPDFADSLALAALSSEETGKSTDDAMSAISII